MITTLSRRYRRTNEKAVSPIVPVLIKMPRGAWLKTAEFPPFPGGDGLHEPPYKKRSATL
jgi:hypothetical protein